MKLGKIGHDGKELMPEQSPQVNGYGFVATPSPAPGMFTARNSSCGMVMFSQACVKNSVWGRGVSQHALPGHMTSTI